jgi:hypothetical protein
MLFMPRLCVPDIRNWRNAGRMTPGGVQPLFHNHLDGEWMVLTLKRNSFCRTNLWIETGLKF